MMENGDKSEKDRERNGFVTLKNPHIAEMEQDVLYHLALGSGSHDLQEMFGDVRYVVVGGTPRRMEMFAHYIMDQINYKLPTGANLIDISKHSYRYAMYKIGPVLSVSHGMGIPSVSILLHELIKLMYHSKAKDPHFFRVGTSGGIGLEGGNIVVTTEAVDGLMRPYLEQPVLGKLKRRPAELDAKLAQEIASLAKPTDGFQTVTGKTMCTYDFYEGQGRLDGAFCDFKMDQKLAFLDQIYKAGVVNMEMESLAFAALCHEAGIKAAVLCVTLLNRLEGDQIGHSKEVLEEWQCRPQQLLARYIRKDMGLYDTELTVQLKPQGTRSPRKMSFVNQESTSYE